MPSTAAGADARRELAEYDVGELIRVTPLPAGSQSACRVTTRRGSYLLKPAYRAADVELQALTAPLLTARGVRQPQVVPTAAGGLITSSGFVLLEWLPGMVALEPSPQQTIASMRHVGAFHAELGRLAPDYRADPGSVWSQAADSGFLVAELPGLLAHHGLGDTYTQTALELLQRYAAGLAALPRQVVHGDIGPDNVLMKGDQVVALIDFTPYWEAVLFAACSALYWYHIYGHTAPSADGLRSSLTAIGDARQWQADELALWPAGLIREALRRLAIPLVLSDRDGTGHVPRAGPRLEAVGAVVRVLTELSGHT